MLELLQDGDSKHWSRNGPKELLVDPASATHGRSWETGNDYIVSLDENHSNMIKFSDYDRDGYEKVCDVVRDFVKHAGIVIKARIKNISSKNMCSCQSASITGLAKFEASPLGTTQRTNV